MRKSIAVLAVIVVIAAASAYFYFYYVSVPNVYIRLIDPPSVPSGTQSLNISYSSVTVTYLSPGSSSVSNNVSSGAVYHSVSSSVKGTVNLLSAVNVSVVLAGVSVPSGAKITSVSFNVTSSSIDINGVTYPVRLAESKITVNTAQNSFNVNGTTSVLISFSPRIISTPAANSTSYFLIPSLKAVVTHGLSGDHSANAGERINLTEKERSDLNSIKSVNISVISASISTANNETSVLVTVKDNSNQSIDLKHVLIFGNMSLLNITPTAGVNASHDGVNTSHEGEAVGLESELPEFESGGNAINFLISSNGSLFLPATGVEDIPGFVLSPGQNVTLSFIGSIKLGHGVVHMSFIKGDTYQAVVKGEESASAQTAIVAS